MIWLLGLFMVWAAWRVVRAEHAARVASRHAHMLIVMLRRMDERHADALIRSAERLEYIESLLHEIRWQTAALEAEDHADGSWVQELRAAVQSANRERLERFRDENRWSVHPDEDDSDGLGARLNEMYRLT